MSIRTKTIISAIVLCVSAGGAQAGVVDLGLNGANVFSFTNFTASSGDVEGSILAGGNVTLGSYSVNAKNKDAYGSYSLIAGGNLTLTSGSIKNGPSIVGGTSAITWADTGTITKGAAPASLSMLASSLTSTSSSLSQVAATGSTAIQWSNLNLTGSNKSVEVFNIDGRNWSSVTDYKFFDMAPNATLVLNISGTSDKMQGGLQNFNGYNVLFNFYEATSLSINTGVYGSILAPLASVSTNSSGQINGNVVVNSWNSSTQINANNYFNAANVTGFTAAATVPEPETYAMLLGGLGLMGLLARRKQARQA